MFVPSLLPNLYGAKSGFVPALDQFRQQLTQITEGQKFVAIRVALSVLAASGHSYSAKFLQSLSMKAIAVPVSSRTSIKIIKYQINNGLSLSGRYAPIQIYVKPMSVLAHKHCVLER